VAAAFVFIKETTHLERAMCCQAPNQLPNYIPELGLGDLRGETTHAKLDKTEDSLDDLTISCSEKGIDGIENRREVLWREIICTRG